MYRISRSLGTLLLPQARAAGITECSATSTSYGPIQQAVRGFAGKAKASEPPADEEGSKPEAPKRRGGRYGTLLMKRRPDQFQRMRTIMGYQDVVQEAGSPKPVESVTISLLQTLKYLELDPGYKYQLAAYRIGTMNRDLAQVLDKTQQYLKQTDVPPSAVAVAAQASKALPAANGKGSKGSKR